MVSETEPPGKREQEIRELIARALDRFRRISRTIENVASQDGGVAGMGTTLTAVGIFGLDSFVFHVGDSRAYFFRQGVLDRLTRDQTVVQAFVESGYITPEQAKTHRLRHVPRSPGREAQATIRPRSRCSGSSIRTASYSVRTASLRWLKTTQSSKCLAMQIPTVACQLLIDQALQAGGKDNVTVVVADYSLPIDTTA